MFPWMGKIQGSHAIETIHVQLSELLFTGSGKFYLYVI